MGSSGEYLNVDAVVVDIDDTIVNTDRRRHAAWCRVLGRKIPLQEVESHGSREILRRYAFSSRKIWEKFWMLTLCVEESGGDLLELDKPIPHASETLNRWNQQHKLVYLTGRTENMRQLTVDELRRFGFPTREADLEMFALKDWIRFFSSTASVLATRSKMFSSISEQYNILRVIDDNPRFFAAYRKAPVPDRVGLLRKKRFSPREYLENGATRVVESWEQLREPWLT
ncbi:hypothetical protein GWN49_08285 [Candidatus Bathyarchaeota archaeon]|nr:hypothetical protein [Candidatus Bathyarchaeota archaeon]